MNSTTQQTADAATQVIDKLASELAVPAEKVMEIMAHGNFMTGAATLVVSVVVATILLSASYISYRQMLMVYNHDREDAIYGALMIVLVLGFASFIAGDALIDAIIKMAAPRYAALQELGQIAGSMG